MKYDLNDIECKIFFESDSEFEEIRHECLKEDNWLKENYTKENLVIEDHSGYGVLFKKSTGQPIIMGGVFNDGRFPPNVARHFNRIYTFPEFRMKPSEMLQGFTVSCILVDKLKEINNYDVYIMTMQNRKKKSRGFWDVWVHYMNEASNNAWTKGNGYIQSCPHNVQKCWQNFVWQETVPGAFSSWNPKIIDHEMWSSLDEGK